MQDITFSDLIAPIICVLAIVTGVVVVKLGNRIAGDHEGRKLAMGLGGAMLAVIGGLMLAGTVGLLASRQMLLERLRGLENENVSMVSVEDADIAQRDKLEPVLAALRNAQRADRLDVDWVPAVEMSIYRSDGRRYQFRVAKLTGTDGAVVWLYSQGPGTVFSNQARAICPNLPDALAAAGVDLSRPDWKDQPDEPTVLTRPTTSPAQNQGPGTVGTEP